MEQIIFKIADQIAYLNNLNEVELYDFTKRFLQRGIGLFYVGNQEPYERLVDIYKKVDTDLEKKINRTITVLLFDFKSDSKQYQLLFPLLFLVGRLRIINKETNSRRIDWLGKKRFINQYRTELDKSNLEDIHLVILRSIADQIPSNIEEEMENIALFGVSDKGIETNPKYFPICYRILYGINKDYASKYFDKLIELGAHGQFNLATEMHFLLEKHNRYISRYILNRFAEDDFPQAISIPLSISLGIINRNDVFPQSVLNELSTTRAGISDNAGRNDLCNEVYYELYAFLSGELFGKAVTLNMLGVEQTTIISDHIVREITLYSSNIAAVKNEANIFIRSFKGLYYLNTSYIPNNELIKNANNESLVALAVQYVERKYSGLMERQQKVTNEKLRQKC